MKSFINTIALTILMGLFFMLLVQIKDAIKQTETSFGFILMVIIIASAYSSTKKD